jgi:molecular chaperone GrpE
MPATAGVGTPAVRQEGQVEAEAQPPSEGAEIATPAEADELRSQMAELEEQLKETRDRYLRALADLDNARKRARQQIAEAQVQGAAGVLRDVLTVVDGLELALETAKPGKPGRPGKSSGEVKAVYDGIHLIAKQLLDMLARRGVRPIAAVGKPFDTSRHEAVAQVPVAASQEEGVVAAEVQKGYMFGDRVLRPSRVAVTIWRPVEEKKPQAPD